jgi:hypothetical protein
MIKPPDNSFRVVFRSLENQRAKPLANGLLVLAVVLLFFTAMAFGALILVATAILVPLFALHFWWSGRNLSEPLPSYESDKSHSISVIEGEYTIDNPTEQDK